MIRRILLAAISTTLVAGLLATEADANHRFKNRHWRGFDRYYAGPVYVPVPRFYRYFVDPDDAFVDAPDGEYGDNFDSAYYEPSIDNPPAKPASRKKKSAASPSTSTKTVVQQTAGIAAKPAAAAALSCDKAAGIISGFGFSGVKASDCDGQVYAFSATRDGKPYAIKLNATSGELTEVHKLQ